MPTSRTIPLSVPERKALLPFGAQTRVAGRCGVTKAYVSLVVSDDVRPKTPRGWKTLRRVRVALARELRMPVDIAFGSSIPPTTPAAAATEEVA
jgi:hypothetical protein